MAMNILSKLNIQILFSSSGWTDVKKTGISVEDGDLPGQRLKPTFSSFKKFSPSKFKTAAELPMIRF